MLLIVSLIIFSFVGEYRKAASELASLADDSGYGDSSPAKLPRLEVALGVAAAPLVDEVESAYNSLYLTKPGSLVRTYNDGIRPPLMDSPYKMVRALNVSPNHTGGLRDQITRLACYRARPNGPQNYPQVDIVDEEDEADVV